MHGFTVFVMSADMYVILLDLLDIFNVKNSKKLKFRFSKQVVM